MEGLRLKGKIERVTLLQGEGTAETKSVVLFEKKKKKRKKSTWALRAPEAVVNRVLNTAEEFVTSLNRRHKDSCRSDENNWLIDLGGNVFRAVSDSRKKLRFERVLDGK
jgi:hypothetical protein